MAQIDKYSRMQILLSGHMDRFARMHLRIRKLRFALGLDQVQNLRIRKFCVFAKVEKMRSHGVNASKICVYAKFAYVSKSVHVTSPLDRVLLTYMGLAIYHTVLL